MHKDSRGRVIDQEDFYLDLVSARVLYFTGKYNKRNNPIFQDSYGPESPHTRSLTSTYVKIANPHLFLSQLKKDVEWMDEKLSGLEELSQSQPK